MTVSRRIYSTDIKDLWRRDSRHKRGTSDTDIIWCKSLQAALQGFKSWKFYTYCKSFYSFYYSRVLKSLTILTLHGAYPIRFDGYAASPSMWNKPGHFLNTYCQGLRIWDIIILWSKSRPYGTLVMIIHQLIGYQ